MVKIADHSAVIFGTHFPNRLFVGCLPPKAAAQDLAEFFSYFGTVNEAKIVLDENGNSKRFGFVSFTHEKDVFTVLQHGSIFFWGKKINVGPAIKKVLSDDVKGKPAKIVLDDTMAKSGGKSHVVYQPLNKCTFPVQPTSELMQNVRFCHVPFVYPADMYSPQIDALQPNVFSLPTYGFQPPCSTTMPVALPDPNAQILPYMHRFPQQNCNFAGCLEPSFVNAEGRRNQLPAKSCY